MTRPVRRPLNIEQFVKPDPLGEAVFVDTLGVAGDLDATLEALRGFDQTSIKGLLFRKPPGGLGKFEWIEEVAPPIDMAAIMTSMKSRFGGGEYRLQIFAGGKTRKVIEFPIMGDPMKPAGLATPEPAMNMQSMMMMMMQMNEASRKDQQDQQRFAMEQQQRRDTQFMQAMTVIVPVIAPLMFGGREKLSELLVLMNANKPEASTMKDTIATFVELKKLTAGEGDKAAGFDADDVVGSIARLAGPVLGAAGRAFNSARGGGAGAHEEPAPQQGDGQLHLPAPDPAPAPSASGAAPAPGNRVLALIRPHVAYFFSASHDPGLAAEAIADIMERGGVTEGDVNELVTAFALAADWKADLAAQGLDLRSNPQWADDFLAELVGVWTENHGDGGRAAGGTGGVADVGPDAPVDPPGLHLPGDPGTGAEAHE